MKNNFVLIFSLLLFLAFSCKKDSSFTSAPVNLEFSTDTVFFDTVFTSIGSITQRVKIFNRSKQAVRIAEIKLMGGASSPYQININGISASQLSNFELAGNDSVNLFVKVTINPTAANLPFIVADSISFLTNGNLQKLQLQAYGQNARFLKDAVIDENTTWDKHLPYVIHNLVEVKAGTTLTIAKGSRIYFHKGAGITINGTLKIEGEATDSVTLASDRQERIYAEEPGQWKGLYFSETSKDNLINHATIKNALIGLQLDSLPENDNPKLVLVNSIVKNMEVAGLLAYNTSLNAFNNIISNCGKHLFYASAGGKYNLKQNTLCNLNYYFSRSTPSLFFSDQATSTTTNPLELTLVNNIIWGSLQDELIVEKKGNALTQLIRSNLIKSRDKNLEGWSNIVNEEPLFENVRNTNFNLLSTSPAADKGEDLSSDPDFLPWLLKDKKEKSRLFPSELGCYEIL